MLALATFSSESAPQYSIRELITPNKDRTLKKPQPKKGCGKVHLVFCAPFSQLLTSCQAIILYILFCDMSNSILNFLTISKHQNAVKYLA